METKPRQPRNIEDPWVHAHALLVRLALRAVTERRKEKWQTGRQRSERHISGDSQPSMSGRAHPNKWSATPPPAKGRRRSQS